MLIEDSEFNNNVVGLMVWNVRDNEGITIRTTSFQNNDKWGVLIWGDTLTDVLIENSIVANNDGLGLGYYGIDFNTYSEAMTNVEVHYTSITGHTVGGGLKNRNSVDTAIVDAEKNWWGDATGASHSSNPHGTGQGGDSVTDYVDFIPWYATSTTTPTTQYVSVLHNPVIAYSDTIQGGIDAALSGDTLEIAAVTLAEGPQIQVDKDLTITGAGRSLTIVEPTGDTGASGDPRGWFLVKPGVTLHLSDLTLDGDGYKIYQAIRWRGDGSVHNCDFKNILYNPSGPHYSGLAIVAFGGNVDVTGCTFTNIGRVGVLYYGSVVTGSTFSGNTYIGKGNGDWLDYALDISAGAQVTVKGNTISDNRGIASSDGSVSAGILVSTLYGSGTKSTILGNTITRNSYGIFVGYSSSDTSTVIAHCNNIINNVNYGVYSTNPQVDATYNWWGDVSGPYHSTTNPSGTGDSVSDRVDYDPWSYRIDPCKPKSKGFWKTHLEAVEIILDEYGPIYLGDFAVSTTTIAKSIFENAKAKNANTMLAAELLATKLNLLHFAHISMDGSVSYWALDEGTGTTAADSTGNNDGTLYNGPQWIDGISGKALDFDGSNEYVEVPDTDDLSFGDGLVDSPFTISAWIKMDKRSNFIIVSKDNDWLPWPTFSNREYDIRMVGDGYLHFYTMDSSANAWIGRRCTTKLKNNQWYHIIGTYDGSGSCSGFRIYVNGERKDTADYSSGTYVAMENGVAPLRIGRQGLTSPMYGNGKIDEVRIYNEVISGSMALLQYTIVQSDQFLADHGYNGPSDPGPKPKGADKEEALDLKDILEAYNRGL
jgi:hypothetical protein